MYLSCLPCLLTLYSTPQIVSTSLQDRRVKIPTCSSAKLPQLHPFIDTQKSPLSLYRSLGSLAKMPSPSTSHRPPHPGTKYSTTLHCSDCISQTHNKNHLSPTHKHKPKRTKTSKQKDEQFDLSTSDLAPPSILVKRSIKLVEAWLAECERAAARSERSDSDLDKGSMVSLWGKGVVRRPANDVAAFKVCQRDRWRREYEVE
jgi:hypothetical protein